MRRLPCLFAGFFADFFAACFFPAFPFEEEGGGDAGRPSNHGASTRATSKRRVAEERRPRTSQGSPVRNSWLSGGSPLAAKFSRPQAVERGVGSTETTRGAPAAAAVRESAPEKE